MALFYVAEPMPEPVRAYVQSAWDQVEASTGQPFNRDFWTRCTPRRSTYPACRAVLAAARQDAGWPMYHALQIAYYCEARNPFDTDTHVALAEALDLDTERFADDLASREVRQDLERSFAVRDRLGVRGFPSLGSSEHGVLSSGYESAETLLPRLVGLGVLS
ncbi:MAG: DsbA family protein [bacterium]|nr:DsbA family protein [bacterium]